MISPSRHCWRRSLGAGRTLLQTMSNKSSSSTSSSSTVCINFRISSRHGNVFRRSSSTDASSSALIVRQDVPAPHCGSIRILKLNNPKTRNAISRALLADLRHHVDEIASEGEGGPTRALILASNIDTSFCAGADLKERAQFTEQDTRDFLHNLRETFSRLSNLPVPSITALSSLALGGGLELALCTHLRVFASTATVALPESRLGIIPGAGGTHRARAVIGRTRALDMMLTGRRVGAAEAYFFGLCDRLIPIDPIEENAENKLSSLSPKEQEAELLAQARETTLRASIDLAREVCEGGPIALRKLIELSQLPDEGAVQGQARENKAYDAVIGTHDRNEALAAFREKRRPVFKGR